MKMWYNKQKTLKQSLKQRVRNKPLKNGVAVNIDGDIFAWLYATCGRDVSEAKKILADYVVGYATGDISDLMFDCFCQNSLFPTDVLSWRGGKDCDVMQVRAVADFYAAIDEDPLAFLLSETRRNGMNAWLSVRMNDAHFGNAPNHWIHGDIYQHALAGGMMIGDVTGQYFAHCLDYGAESIRQKMLAYVCEVLDRYDVDGLELDFMREIFCFDYKKHPECHKIMTEFVADVRQHLRICETRRDHKIRLAVRLCRDIEDNRVFGFDAAEWVRRGLVDVLIPSPRWSSTDSDMPISKWRRLTDGTEVEVWAGLETHLIDPILQSVETVKGFAAQYFAEGADKIYLYNYFRFRSHDMDKNDFSIEEDYYTYMKGVENDAHVCVCWDAAKTRKNAECGTRRHVTTYQENCTKPYRTGEYHPLPMNLFGKITFVMKTGECAGKQVALFVGVTRGQAAPSVWVDGKNAPCLGISDGAYACHPRKLSNPDKVPYAEVDFYAYAVIAAKGNTREIILRGDGICVEYLELLVEDAE